MSEHEATVAETVKIALKMSSVVAGRRTVAVYLAIVYLLADLEMRSAKPNRRATLRILGEAMDAHVANNCEVELARKLIAESKIEEAVTVAVGVCDFCPAVHVNFRDGNGDCFATASVPVANCAGFIRKFQEALAEIHRRHSTPTRKQ